MDNQLVVLATAATDAGRYYVEAVNELTGENVTSPAIYLSISGKGHWVLHRTSEWLAARVRGTAGRHRLWR